MLRLIKSIFTLILVIIGALAYKLCIPVMFILIVCKLWYAPYTWNWFNTIVIPLVCGGIGFIFILIAKYLRIKAVEDYIK